MTKITLLVLIEAWLKSRGLKWKCDPETSRLLIKGNDPLDISIDVEKDRITCTPMTFYDDPKKISIAAIDPDFFAKLENVMKGEERWSSFGKCIVLICDGIQTVWGPMINVVIPWMIDKIDDITDWYGRVKQAWRESI